jgi:hypothetical protein
MKRRTFAILMMTAASVAAAALGGCSAPPSSTSTNSSPDNGWAASPVIESVERRGDTLKVVGRMEPLGRVALKASGEASYAVGADEQGRFEIDIRYPARDTVFEIENREGQDASPAPYRLLVARDPTGPIALMSPGEASRRLDAGGALDGVDSDGAMGVASGRATPGATVRVGIVGRQPSTARVSRDGRWSLAVPGLGDAPAALAVGERRYAYPGGGQGTESPMLERAGQGVRLVWPLSQKSRQSTWFPDRG